MYLEHFIIQNINQKLFSRSTPRVVKKR